MAFLLLSSVIITPLDLAFPDYCDSNIYYKFFTYTLDFLFLADIILTFFSAYENEALEIEDNRSKIIKNYI